MASGEQGQLKGAQHGTAIVNVAVVVRIGHCPSVFDMLVARRRPKADVLNWRGVRKLREA